MTARALGARGVADSRHVRRGLAAFAGILTSAAQVYSARYFETVGHLFHALMLAFLAAMAGFALTEPIGTPRKLHSGHVGDYVTWLTVGLAAIGGVCALSLT